MARSPSSPSGTQEQTRLAMRSSADPRAARTRRTILTAVQELVAEGNPSPSVSEIARRAGISRSSFYTQFAGLEELSSALFADVLDSAVAFDAELRRARDVSELEATRVATARLVAHVGEHRGFYRVGLPATVAAQEQAVRAVAAQFRGGDCLTGASAAGVDPDTAALYLAGGVLTLLRAWVTGELAGSAESVTEQIMALLPAWLASDTAPQSTIAVRTTPVTRSA